MGNGTEQIAPHFLFFRFHAKIVLVFQLCRQRTGKNRHDQHDHGGNQVFGGQKIEGEVWEREDVVVDQDTEEGSKNTPEISLRRQRNEKNCQYEYHRDE
jgi:hypothetical protein